VPSCRISEAIGRRLRSEHCHWLSRWQLAPLECVLRFGQLGEFRTFRTNCPASTTCALALSIAEFGWQDARLLRELPGRFRRQCLSRRNSWRRSTATHRRRHPLYLQDLSRDAPGRPLAAARTRGATSRALLPPRPSKAKSCRKMQFKGQSRSTS